MKSFNPSSFYILVYAVYPCFLADRIMVHNVPNSSDVNKYNSILLLHRGWLILRQKFAVDGPLDDGVVVHNNGGRLPLTGKEVHRMYTENHITASRVHSYAHIIHSVF